MDIYSNISGQPEKGPRSLALPAKCSCAAVVDAQQQYSHDDTNRTIAVDSHNTNQLSCLLRAAPRATRTMTSAESHAPSQHAVLMQLLNTIARVQLVLQILHVTTMAMLESSTVMQCCWTKAATMATAS